nr:hypothetical protein [uncultured Anaerobutyricum sp.]
MLVRILNTLRRRIWDISFFLFSPVPIPKSFSADLQAWNTQNPPRL